MIRKTLKWGFASAALIVVAGLLVGPHRIQDLFATARNHVVENVDELIDSKVRLENEVRQMQREYPRQIAVLRSQLTEVDRAIIEVEEEVILGEQVITLCNADVELLTPAATAAAVNAAYSTESPNREQLVIDRKIVQIERTRSTYVSRVEMARQAHSVLEAERQRIAAELASLERESADFEAQLSLFKSEIESLARSERFIEIASKRRLASDSRLGEEANSAMDRLGGAIAKERAKQAESLRHLGDRQATSDYETRARLMIEGERAPTTEGHQDAQSGKNWKNSF